MAKVPNPYKAAIKGRKARSVQPGTELAHALNTIVTAMDAQAWVSTTADAYYADLTGGRTSLGQAEQTTLHDFQDAIDGQPDEVDQQSWQVHWHNLMGP